MQKDLFEEIITTIENNAEDNKATITNVELWAKSWREERELALTLYVVSSSKCVKILDEGNGNCGLITDEVLKHYKKNNYFREGNKLYKCELIKTY